jgi:kojibiose phosphorylase
MHALIAAWLRDGERCRRYLEDTMRIDLGDGLRNAAGGVHIAAFGGLWQVLIFGIAGCKFTSEGLSFDPYLPPPISRLAFTLRWRGRTVRASIDGATITLAAEGGDVPVRVNRHRAVVRAGRSQPFTFDPAITYWDAQRAQEETHG